MKLQLRFSDDATIELTEIWKLIAQDKPDAAANFCSEIYDLCEMLSNQPLSGRLRQDLQDLKKGIRSFPHGNYLVFYFVENDAVHIAHIIDGRRNIRSFFQNQN